MKTALRISVLIGAALLAYHPSLSGQFVYDDKPAIVKNPLIRTLRQLPLILGTPYWNIGGPKESQGGLYRPLTTASFALNYAWGKLDPEGYHLVNILLHIGVALLLWMLCLQLGFQLESAWVAGLLFALLPVHTEAVSNIVGRSEVLAAFFILASWLMVCRRNISTGNIFGGITFYLCALLSKENSAAFLGVLILSDGVFSREPWKEVVQERWAVWCSYAGILFLYLGWRHVILGSIFSTGSFPYFDEQRPLIIFLTMAKFAVQHYLWPLVTGLSLCADYTRPAITDSTTGDPASWACLIAPACLAVFCLYSIFKNKNRKAFCIVLAGILLFPVSNLLVKLEVIGAERFLYLPSFGYCMLLGLLYEKARRDKIMISACTRILLVGVCLEYGVITNARSRVWQTEESFWKATVQDAPQSPRSWNGLGTVMMAQKNYDEALADFNKALGLNRMLLDADYNMATCFFLKGDYERAKRGYLYVVGFKPYDPDALFHLALISEKEKDFKSAGTYYERLLAINPSDGITQENLVRMKGIMQRAVEVRL